MVWPLCDCSSRHHGQPHQEPDSQALVQVRWNRGTGSYLLGRSIRLMWCVFLVTDLLRTFRRVRSISPPWKAKASSPIWSWMRRCLWSWWSFRVGSNWVVPSAIGSRFGFNGPSSKACPLYYISTRWDSFFIIPRDCHPQAKMTSNLHGLFVCCPRGSFRDYFNGWDVNFFRSGLRLKRVRSSGM